uniref:Uncharacterized protein n=1 Tax=Glycine max TaxID=3847 RepID=A0A0R0H5L4_SOYBN
MVDATKPINNVDASDPMPPTTIFAKSLVNVSKIEVFNGQSFRHWQERVHTLLDMHGVVFAFFTPKLDASVDANQLRQWTMNEEKVIKVQINKYHKLLETLKTENIFLPDEFVSELQIEKLLES